MNFPPSYPASEMSAIGPPSCRWFVDFFCRFLASTNTAEFNPPHLKHILSNQSFKCRGEGGPCQINLGFGESLTQWAWQVVVRLPCTLAIINFLQQWILQASASPKNVNSAAVTSISRVALMRMLAAGFLCCPRRISQRLRLGHWVSEALHLLPPAARQRIPKSSVARLS